jgi:superfamily II DNA or RNA helicase
VLSERFCTNVLRDGHEKLMALRTVKPDAAGIVVCVDTEHAKKVARWLRNMTGEMSIIAVSDEETASPGDPITEFGADGATARWIVSVRQVSEGVDIPRSWLACS